MPNLPVAVDVMGGDLGVAELVNGAVAASQAGSLLTIVGNEKQISADGIPVQHASESIGMDEDPAGAVRNKADASVVVAAQMVRDQLASGMVSAGNTGATMAAALFRIGRLPSVLRPAVATVIPVPGSTPTILLDSGANAECQPEWLAQFGQMGSVLAELRYRIEKPRVGLLSIGEESTKGSSLIKQAHTLLAESEGLNFIGNVEGRDIMTDKVDVVVTDGFTGNVVLKSIEGTAKSLMSAVVGAMTSTDEAKDAAKTLMGTLVPLAESLDPDTYGGAVLLGVEGVCVISHGAASSKAYANAVALAADLADSNLVEALRRRVVAPLN